MVPVVPEPKLLLDDSGNAFGRPEVVSEPRCEGALLEKLTQSEQVGVGKPRLVRLEVPVYQRIPPATAIAPHPDTRTLPAHPKPACRRSEVDRSILRLLVEAPNHARHTPLLPGRHAARRVLYL